MQWLAIVCVLSYVRFSLAPEVFQCFSRGSVSACSNLLDFKLFQVIRTQPMRDFCPTSSLTSDPASVYRCRQKACDSWVGDEGLTASLLAASAS